MRTTDAILEELARRLRLGAGRLRTQWGGAFSVADVFERYDRLGRGVVSTEDFHAALEVLGATAVSAVEAQALEQRFGRLGQGGVDYRDFVRFVDADDDDLRFVAGAVAAKLEDQERKGLDVYLPFEMADSGNSGFIAKRDFRAALKTLDLPLTDRDSDRFARKFEQLGSNADLVNYTDFITFVRDSSSSTLRRSNTKNSFHHGTRGEGFDGFSHHESSVLVPANRWQRAHHSPLRRRHDGTEFDSGYFGRGKRKDDSDEDPNDPLHFQHDFFPSRMSSPRGAIRDLG